MKSHLVLLNDSRQESAENRHIRTSTFNFFAENQRHRNHETSALRCIHKIGDRFVCPLEVWGRVKEMTLIMARRSTSLGRIRSRFLPSGFMFPLLCSLLLEIITLTPIWPPIFRFRLLTFIPYFRLSSIPEPSPANTLYPSLRLVLTDTLPMLV